MRDRLYVAEVEFAAFEAAFATPFATSRRTTRKVRNLLVTVRGRRAGEALVGVGEALPRGAKLTGDPAAALSGFLRLARSVLQGALLELSSPVDAVRSVRELASTLSAVAAEAAGAEVAPERAFRGVRAGIEAALLDLAGRALSVSVTALLGGAVREVEVTASTLSAAQAPETLAARIAAAPACRVWRLKASGRLADDLARLETAIEVLEAAGDPPRGLWFDVNEGWSPDEAARFVEGARRRLRGRAVAELVLEQPVARAADSGLAQLRALAVGRDGDDPPIRLMADESVWDTPDLERLVAASAVDAINIKMEKTGGLLGALDLALRARELDPDLRIYLGRMLGGSFLTLSAVRTLGELVPRLDYYTGGPFTGLATDFARSGMKYARGRVLSPQKGAGFGVTIDQDRLRPLLVSPS